MTQFNEAYVRRRAANISKIFWIMSEHQKDLKIINNPGGSYHVYVPASNIVMLSHLHEAWWPGLAPENVQHRHLTQCPLGNVALT